MRLPCPIIIEGQHVANIFFGQFFFEDEAIDIKYFESQAEKYGFDKPKYIEYLKEVPVISRKKAETLKQFNAALAIILTKNGYANLLLKREKINELRIANQKIEESELKFRKLFEQAGVGVVMVESTTGRFLKINNKFASMLGYSIDELRQLNFKSITHPDDLERNLDQMDLLIKNQITEFSMEKRYIRKDGSILWSILTVTGVQIDADGKLNNVAIAQDITERKKIEFELLESELKFRRIFEQAGVGVAQVDVPSGRLLKINKKFADMLGYSMAELSQLSFQDITHPDDLAESQLQVRRLLQNNIKEFSIEKKYVRKDGTFMWAILSVTSMGEVVDGKKNNISIIQDITDRKETEQNLLESELKFRKLFEQAGAGVAQVESTTGKFIKINKKFADIVGYTVDEMLQLTSKDFTHPDDTEISLQFQNRLIKEKNLEFSIEKRYIRKDGKIVWVKRTVTSMWETEEGSRHHITIVQDITASKKAELDLLESEFKFRRLFELAGVGVAQVDISTGKFVKVNKKLAAMLGYTIAEMLTLTFKQITYPEDLKESLLNQDRLIKKQIGDFSVEKRYLRKDGTFVWAILTASSMGEVAGGENFQIAIVQEITERRKAEQDLRESEGKFKNIFSQSPVGLILFDNDGKFLDCNPTCLSMFGIDNVKELAGFDLFNAPNLTEQQKRNVKKGKNIEFEINFDFDVIKKLKLYNTCKSGLSFFSCISSAFELHGNDKPGFLLHLIDNTERKRVEHELIESEEKFKSVFYQSPIGLELYDSQGKLLDCNPACCSMFGIDSINEVIGFNLFDDPNLTKKQKKEIKEGKDVQFEIDFDFGLVKKLNLYNTSKSGRSVFSCLATSFKKKGTDNTGILLHLIDITESKKAQQILKEENERFQTTMNAMDSVVYVADMESHEILFVNKYITDLFGDIKGKKCYSALQGKTAPCEFCTNHLLIDANGNARDPHIWDFQNSVTKGWYQCHDQAIRWTNGDLVRFEIATDITKNIENEQALKESAKKLSELNLTKDKFFSIIAHDLKNPFAVLMSSSELLSRYLEKNDFPKSKAKAAMISKASSNGYALLENLLVWAKSQTGGH